LGDVILPNKIVKSLRSIFPRENLIAHRKILAGLEKGERRKRISMMK